MQTILFHELAIAAIAALVVGLTWGDANQVGTWTFMILWLMRLSAKLDVYLGVPNPAEELLPDHLRYLATYFRRRPMNLLFPVSVTVPTAIVILVLDHALAAETMAAEAVGLTFLAALLVLAIVEHWFLVLPLPATALWSWGLRSHDGAAAGVAASPMIHPARSSKWR